MAKNIIVLMDGTWDSANQANIPNGTASTNVVKLNNILINDKKSQLVFYDDGIGADAYGLSKFIDGATGLGINDKIIQGYQFIMQNFTSEDKIYLFGFSRGAYTVRYIADFIAHMGLLKLTNNESSIEQFNRINDYFNHYKQIRNTDIIEVDLSIANNCYIQMIGVWDTVGELGIPVDVLKNFNSKQYAFSDTILHNNVLFGYQALAIDEKRSDFIPCLWNSRNGIEQIWFAGSHSDIGGGYLACGLSDITLKWMIDMAVNYHQILIDDTKFKLLKPDPLDQIHDPSTLFPYNIKLVQLRSIPAGSLVKESVKIRILDKTLGYNPTNLPINCNFTDCNSCYGNMAIFKKR